MATIESVKSTRVIWTISMSINHDEIVHNLFLTRAQCKVFLTEEKLIENMRTLSLQISVNSQPIDGDQ